MAPQNPNTAPDKLEESTASHQALSEWLDMHQHTDNKSTKVIVLDSQQDGTYGFQAAFLIFILEGDVDLQTNTMSNGNFYAVAPVWGRVNIMERISGDLNGPITCRFERGANFNGQFTLTLDKTTNKLTIDYNINVKFAGELQDKISLLTVPKTEVLTKALIQAQPTLLTSYTQTDDHKLFDKWLEDHLDEETNNIVISSFLPGDLKSGSEVLAATKSYSFSVGFLGIFELEGAIDPINIGLSATLYVKVPLWGRTKITSLSGSLKQGINLDINVLVASGTVGLKLVGRDVHAVVKLSVKFVGDIDQDVKLFTLPFDMYE